MPGRPPITRRLLLVIGPNSYETPPRHSLTRSPFLDEVCVPIPDTRGEIRGHQQVLLSIQLLTFGIFRP